MVRHTCVCSLLFRLFVDPVCRVLLRSYEIAMLYPSLHDDVLNMSLEERLSFVGEKDTIHSSQKALMDTLTRRYIPVLICPRPSSFIRLILQMYDY
jgi:hypothetical protein